jgi:sec-independent protein translocase protein TatA
MSGFDSPAKIIIVLIIALVVLGPKRLPEVGRSLGHGIREFKDSVNGVMDHDDPPTPAATPPQPPLAAPEAAKPTME